MSRAFGDVAAPLGGIQPRTLDRPAQCQAGRPCAPSRRGLAAHAFTPTTAVHNAGKGTSVRRHETAGARSRLIARQWKRVYPWRPTSKLNAVSTPIRVEGSAWT